MFVALALFVTSVASRNFLISNDDGWAVAQARAQFDSLDAAGFDVCNACTLDLVIVINHPTVSQIVLSAPAVAHEGTGAQSREPTVLKTPCQFNTCPVGSPAEGFFLLDRRSTPPPSAALS